MTNRLTRITTLLGSLLLSATAFAAPKRFDTEIAVPPADEDAVMHYISKCSPFTTPGLRICEQMPLDLNKDGNTDLLVGANQTGPKRFYAGRGEGLFNPAVYFGFEQPTSSLTVADLDGDLDLDMVETVRSNGTAGVNLIYVNHNNTLTSLLNDEQQLDGTHYRSSSAAVGDVNNDGRLDIVVANETPGAQSNPAGATMPYTHTNYVYLNQSTPNNIVFGAAIPIDPAGTEGYTRRILLLDIEGDGDLDLVGTKASNHLDPSGQGNVLYVNHTANGGAGPNPFDAPIELSPTNPADNTDVANSIAAGDLDGDGDPDLVFGTWSRMNGAVPPAPEAAPDRYYVNNSTAAGPNFNTTGTFGPQAHSTNVRLGNFDCNALPCSDTDLDALVVTFEGADRLHLNRNDSVPGSFFDPVGFALVEPAGHDLSRGLDTADLNKDGSLDVVIVHRDQPGLRFLNNDTCSGGGNTCNPFQNQTANITGQPNDATEPQGVAINIAKHLGLLSVVDSDNVFPADFTVRLPVPTSQPYTCTNGTSAGYCVGTQITPTNPTFLGVLQPIILRVSDGQNESPTFDSFRLNIGAGSPPVFTSTPVTTATEDAPYTYTVTATDNDGQQPPLTISFDTSPGSPPVPGWLSLSPTTNNQATLSGTPQQPQVGPHQVSLRVSDGALSATQPFTITVANVNDAPVITTTSLPNATQGIAYSSTVTASDDDDPLPALSFSATGLPAGLSISTTGIISGTPTASGPFTVAVSVTDGKVPAPVTANLPLQVSAPGNQPPTFTPPAAQTATVGQAFTLNLTASDPDTDPLTFSATGLPAGLAISPAGAISGTPTTAGPATVNVTVNDGRGGTATGSFDITVQAGGGPPNQNPTVTAPGPQTASVGTAFSLTVTGSDPDSDPLTFSATGLPAGLTMSATGAISGTPTTNVGSPFTVVVSVSDGKGGSGSASFQLTVNPAPVNNPPPAPAPSGGSGGGGSFGLGELLAMLVLAGAAGLRRRRLGAVRSGAL